MEPNADHAHELEQFVNDIALCREAHPGPVPALLWPTNGHWVSEHIRSRLPHRHTAPGRAATATPADEVLANLLVALGDALGVDVHGRIWSAPPRGPQPTTACDRLILVLTHALAALLPGSAGVHSTQLRVRPGEVLLIPAGQACSWEGTSDRSAFVELSLGPRTASV